MAVPLRLMTELVLTGGVQKDIAQHVIGDSEAFYIQDGLMHKPGYLQRRGGITVAPGTTDLPGRFDGVVAFTRADGALRYAFLSNYNSAINLLLTDSSFSTTLTVPTTGLAATLNDPGYIMDAHPCQGGEVLIGIARKYAHDSTTSRGLFRWKGSFFAQYAVGTISVTAGSTTVVGTTSVWTTGAEPGMYLTIGDVAYPGAIVKAITDNTHIVLEQPWSGPTLTTQNYKLKAMIGLPANPDISVGRITTSTSSAVVNGGGTKFKDQSVINQSSLSSDSYVLALIGNDYRYVGTTFSVQSNSQLTLVANAEVAVTNAKYIITSIPAPTGYSVETSIGPFLGFLNAYWNGMQFFANQDIPVLNPVGGPSLGAGSTNLDTIWIADPINLTSVDATREGSSINLPKTNTGNFITALCPTETGLIVCRENETYLLQGDSPQTLKATKILDDGCYSSAAMVSYQAGCVWPGRRGIYYFDGVRTTNILSHKAQDYYITSLGTQDIDTYRMWAMEQQDHYILHTEYAANTAMIKASVHNHQGWCINIQTGQLSFLSNLALRGATKIPKVGTIFVFGKYNGGTPRGFIAQASDLFKAYAGAEVVGHGWNAYSAGGPRFFAESKLYDAGMPEIKKRWKLIKYWSNTAEPLVVSIFQGLDKTQILNQISATTPYGVWKNNILRFSGNSTHLGFQIECPNAVAGDVQVGALALGYKQQRLGKV